LVFLQFFAVVAMYLVSTHVLGVVWACVSVCVFSVFLHRQCKSDTCQYLISYHIL